jgi:hypothetical protein
MDLELIHMDHTHITDLTLMDHILMEATDLEHILVAEQHQALHLEQLPLLHQVLLLAHHQVLELHLAQGHHLALEPKDRALLQALEQKVQGHPLELELRDLEHHQVVKQKALAHHLALALKDQAQRAPEHKDLEQINRIK